MVSNAPTRKLKEDADCPKCGNNPPLGIRYCPGNNNLPPNGGVTCSLNLEEEHIHRQCGRCSYEFAEKTVDD